MRLSVSSRLREPRRITPIPLHACTRASDGRRCAMSSASALEATSMVTRTDMTPPQVVLWPMAAGSVSRTADSTAAVSSNGALAGHAPAPHTHVREEQDDEDDREDDVGNHRTSSFLADHRIPAKYFRLLAKCPTRRCGSGSYEAGVTSHVSSAPGTGRSPAG